MPTQHRDGTLGRRHWLGRSCFATIKRWDYLIGAVSWDIIQASLTQLVVVLLNQVSTVEDGQQRHQQTPVLVICHPPTIVALA